ncbi:hypothetical protein [Spirosoma gilvum]
MKKLLILLIGLPSLNVVYAQTQKGNGILSGSVSATYDRQTRPFSTISNAGPTSILTNWAPALTITAGRFWKDNWLAALSVSGSLTQNQQNQSDNPDRTYPNTFYAITVTPFVRRYWQVGAVYVFAGAGVSVTTHGSKQSYFDVNGQLIESGRKTSTTNVTPQVEAGVNYLLTNRLGIQLVASTNSFPLTTAGLGAGLVYWTGPGRTATAQEQRENWQTDAGRWILEGGFSVNHQGTNQAAGAGQIAYQDKSSVYSVSPSIGFFVKKNSLLGVSIPIMYSRSNFSSPGASTTQDEVWTVGIEPYFQQYWLSTRLTPYTRVGAGYNHYTSGDYKGYLIDGSIRLGLAYMAGQRFIIETSLLNASVSYLPAGRSEQPGAIKTWSGKISAGLTGAFALRYVLQ